MAITTTKLSSDSYSVDSAGNVSLVKLKGNTVNIPIKMWDSNWTLPASGGNNKNEIAAIAENKADDNSISYSIAVKQTTTQNFGGQTNQTTIQWQYFTATLDHATSPTKLNIDGSKAVWNVQFPGQYETLLGIDMNGDSAVGVVKTLDTQALGSVQIKRDTDGGIYLVEGSQETALNTSNNNFYEQSQLNTMPTPFEMPNGFIQSANKNTRKVVGVEKGDIVQKSALNLFEKLFASVTLPTTFDVGATNTQKATVVVTAISTALEKSLALGAQIANILSLDTATGTYNKAWMDGFKTGLIAYLTAQANAAGGGTFPTFTPAVLKSAWDAGKPTSASVTSLTDTYWLLKQEMNTMVGKPSGKTTTEELVTWQSWIIDKATLTNGVLQASEVKRDFKPGLLEELFKSDINKDNSIGLTPTPDLTIAGGGEFQFARDSDLGAYLVLGLGTQFIEIKPESGMMLNLEMNNAMAPPGRRVVAMTKLDTTKLAEYKLLQTNFTGNLNDTNKAYYVLASSEKTPEGTSNYQFNLVEHNISQKTATLIQNQSQWTKSAADWEGFFNKDLNKDNNIGRGTLTQVTGDLGTERMFKDADGAFFIVEGTVNGDVFTRIAGQEKKLQDPAGNQPMLEFGGTMASSKVIAVKKGTLANFKTALNSSNPVPGQIINDSDTGYFILMQRKWKTTPTDPAEKTQWEVFVAKTDGRFNFNPIQVDAVGKIEEFFDQDFTGDGVKGLNASAAVKQKDDLGTVYVARDDGNPFIVDAPAGQTPKIYDIKIKDGGMMQLEFSNSWAQGSNKRELMAAERHATDANKFYLAIKNTNIWTEFAPGTGTGAAATVGKPKEQVNWEVFTLTVSTDGKSLVMDWNDVSRGNTILGDEAKFNQDLSGDEKIGPQLDKLTPVPTDTFGSRLVRSPDGTLFIQNTTGDPIIISNAQGLENANSWANGSFKSEAIAVEKSGQKYKIAIKSTNVNKNIVFNGTTSSTEEKTDINWNIITLDDTGKVLWGNPQNTDMPVWTKSVASYETEFKQDLNLDGVIGLDVAKLSAVATDKGTAILKRDADKTFYVVDGGDPKAIPNSTWFEFDNNWGNGSNKREAFAVEKVGDVYLLAFKTTNTFNGQSDINWEIQTLNKDTLQIIWVNSSTNMSNTVWTKNIAGYEVKFNQDLNDDGATGLNVDALKLKPIAGDVGNSYLAKDIKTNQAEQGYYIVKKATVPGQADTVVSLDSSGGFEYSNTWTDGSGAKYTNKREAVAVEYINVTVDSTTTPTPHLLFKTTTKADAVTELRWEIVPLDATTLKPDWSKSTSTKSIVIWEGPTKFNQDLNGDGVSSGVPDNLTLLPLDKSGAKLARDKDGGLYIQDGATTLSVQTPGSFEFSNSWNNGSDKGSSKQEAIAVQKTKIENVDYYIIAFKNTNEFNSEKQINWQIIKFDLNGSMIQPTGSNPSIIWTKSISPYEKVDFNDDLNGDGAKGIEAKDLTSVTTDTNGAGLARDIENSVYITEAGQTPVLIKNAGGLESYYKWSGGSNERIAFAALKIAAGGYKILIKNTNINSSNTDVNWQVAEVKADGEIDWSKGSPMVRNVQSLEADFNQDLNGDGINGVDPSKLTSYATNSDGNLLKSSTGEIFIRKDGAYIAVKDEFGNQPILDSSAQWSGGGFTSTPYALKKQADNSYKMAIKMVETINSTTKTSWQIQTIKVTGVLETNKTLQTNNVIAAEDAMLLDLDGDKSVGITKALLESKLTKITTDTTNDTLLKNANGSLYIKMAVPGKEAGDDLLQVTDTVGGSPSFDTVSTWNNGASSRSNTAFGVNETGTGTGVYKLVSKVVSNDAKLVKTGWEIFTLNWNKVVGSNAVIDSSKTIWTDNILTAEKLLGQDINGDADFSGLPKSLTTLELDKVGTGGKYDLNTGAVYINGDLLVTSSNGDSAKLVFTDGALRSEVVAISDKDATNAFGNGANTYDIAISKTLSMALGTQTNWEILTVDAAGKTTKSVDAGSITGYETRFAQDLNGDGVIGSDGITKISVITQDPDVWKDAWGGIYLVKRADKTSVQLKDKVGNAPNFDSLLTLPSGEVLKSELFAVEEQTNNKFLIAIKNTATFGATEQTMWMVHTAEPTGVIDWANSAVIEDISTYETAFNFNLDGKDNIVIVGAVV